jgi:hypothetical protein
MGHATFVICSSRTCRGILFLGFCPGAGIVSEVLAKTPSVHLGFCHRTARLASSCSYDGQGMPSLGVAIITTWKTCYNMLCYMQNTTV